MANRATSGKPAASAPAPSGPPRDAPSVKQPDNIGDEPVKISVELSTRFLEHFSEQLYSSPQKAFEELISNGWDAGANRVDVRSHASSRFGRYGSVSAQPGNAGPRRPSAKTDGRCHIC